MVDICPWPIWFRDPKQPIQNETALFLGLRLIVLGQTLTSARRTSLNLTSRTNAVFSSTLWCSDGCDPRLCGAPQPNLQWRSPGTCGMPACTNTLNRHAARGADGASVSPERWETMTPQPFCIDLMVGHGSTVEQGTTLCRLSGLSLPHVCSINCFCDWSNLIHLKASHPGAKHTNDQMVKRCLQPLGSQPSGAKHCMPWSQHWCKGWQLKGPCCLCCSDPNVCISGSNYYLAMD